MWNVGRRKNREGGVSSVRIQMCMQPQNRSILDIKTGLSIGSASRMCRRILGIVHPNCIAFMGDSQRASEFRLIHLWQQMRNGRWYSCGMSTTRLINRTWRESTMIHVRMNIFTIAVLLSNSILVNYTPRHAETRQAQARGYNTNNHLQRKKFEQIISADNYFLVLLLVPLFISGWSISRQCPGGRPTQRGISLTPLGIHISLSELFYKSYFVGG